MLLEQIIANNPSLQPYEYVNTEITEDGHRLVLHLTSRKDTAEERCPYCKGHVHILGSCSMRLRDMPVYTGTRQDLEISYHRYRCQSCARTFCEEIPFRYPETRISERAASWISSFLRFNIPISTVQKITGVHWDTIKHIQQQIMNEAVADRRRKLLGEGYKPKHLAVDEFAIHKGHRYATCVMDLGTGDVIWVGKGRTKADFAIFFQEIDVDYLSEVEAVAMDMNASYNALISENLPHARIVYDRYHMQAQFGKDVLGTVRLDEARKHRDKARQLRDDGGPRAEMKEEKRLYCEVKRARWILLAGEDSLSDDEVSSLNKILDDHTDLALCHAMKEEMARLFDLRDEDEARNGWTAWFEGAKASGIPALMRFAELKEKRIDGLIAHASHPISTGKLEGFNNRIKVAKRIAYGYRDEDYFFSLIQFLSIPSVRDQSHRKT